MKNICIVALIPILSICQNWYHIDDTRMIGDVMYLNESDRSSR